MTNKPIRIVVEIKPDGDIDLSREDLNRIVDRVLTPSSDHLAEHLRLRQAIRERREETQRLEDKRRLDELEALAKASVKDLLSYIDFGDRNRTARCLASLAGIFSEYSELNNRE